MRFKLLDQLELILGDDESTLTAGERFEKKSLDRLLALRARLEGANDALYRSIRAEIEQGNCPSLFWQWLQSDENPAGGLSFDYLDEVVSGVLVIAEPDPLPSHPPAGMVFYQPTPARHIFQLLRRTALTEDDVLFDLGSGLGHVPLLAGICTGARSIGVEREEPYVACARNAATSFNLDRVSFYPQDVRDADLSSGTVFYLYTPFTGQILTDVLHRLRRESTNRPIRICTFGPCTEAVARENWLRASGKPDPDHITLFHSIS